MQTQLEEQTELERLYDIREKYYRDMCNAIDRYQSRLKSEIVSYNIETRDLDRDIEICRTKERLKARDKRLAEEENGKDKR